MNQASEQTTASSRNAIRKTCQKCKGHCPAGTLDSGLCLDCEKGSDTLAFDLALAARSPFWREVVYRSSFK